MAARIAGNYEIFEQIGSGGMGVVYRGVDTRLSRQVALKILPAECARDSERRARFEREARLVAALDYPNIGRIYGVEEAGDDCYLVLELVPGPTLSERLHAGPVSIEEALDICRQIAAGVEAAHERNIIHRDLKPANVKLTPEGKVKVLDFGLGKSVEADLDVAAAAALSNSPTMTADSTHTGVSLGTAAYMSRSEERRVG